MASQVVGTRQDTKTGEQRNVRKVDFSKMQISSRTKTGTGRAEAPLPRPVVSVGSEEVNGEDLTVINIKLFGRPIIVDKDAFEIKREGNEPSKKVLTGEKTLMLRLADTRSGVPMMQQTQDENSGELINDRVTFTLPNPDVPEDQFDEENPAHWLTFAGVIQARAYGKLEKDVNYRKGKGKGATAGQGFQAVGQGQTAETHIQGAQQPAHAGAGFTNAPTE
jgi:hypothetical protein